MGGKGGMEMRKITLMLLWALILAEAVLLYGLYDQYEAVAAEKNAVERRAGVLKTLFEQTEKELQTEKEKWQMEKQALLKEKRELETEFSAPKDTGKQVDFPGLLQGIYAQLFSGAATAQEEKDSIFQQPLPEEERLPAAPEAAPLPRERNLLEGPANNFRTMITLK